MVEQKAIFNFRDIKLFNLIQTFQTILGTIFNIIEYIKDFMTKIEVDSQTYYQFNLTIFLVLERIYWVFPHEKPYITLLIKNVFSLKLEVLFPNFQNYKKFFIEKLEKNNELELFFPNHLDEKEFIDFKMNSNENSLQNSEESQGGFVKDFEDLLIENGNFIEKKIEAGKSFEHFIEVWNPDSLIHWSFYTSSYDISFEFDYVGDFRAKMKDPINLFKSEKVDCSDRKCKGTFLALHPGVYRLKFSIFYF